MLGKAWFAEAFFDDDAQFNGVVFNGDAWFSRARFSGKIQFFDAKFSRDAVFNEAMFERDAQFDYSRFEGEGRFSDVTFGGEARFEKAKFCAGARFVDAVFDGPAWFLDVNIEDAAMFSGVKFGSDAWFSGAEIGNDAMFVGARFDGPARFDGVVIAGYSMFGGATFSDEIIFGEARFDSSVTFKRAKFESAGALGPLVCAGTLNFSEAVFGAAVTIEAVSAGLLCRRTRWFSTAALRLRYSAVDLSDAVVEYPVSISARSRPFIGDAGDIAEPGFVDPRVRVMSLRGVDAAHLVLTDIDLADCRFAGTIHLDQLRLEGRYTLAVAPSGLRWRGVRPVRWTPRRTLAEEHHWRATRSADGWTPAPEEEEALEPAALAPVYRQLRKSFEDSKHEPGAADFYYGEMEMRRHADDIPWAERALLTAYWALSGYGLRASRAVGWLLAAMTATVLAMMLWGLPQDSSKPISTGTLNGRNITMTTDTPDPVNPTGPWSERLSTERFEKSLRVVINSVVFRSSGQDLTTAGTYTEMASRFTEPVLLGLAILAVRGRVKR